MRKRPFLLFACTAIFLYFPLLLGAKIFQGEPIHWVQGILYGVLPFVLITGLLKVTKLGWYTLVGFVFLWGIHDLYLYYSAKTQGPQVLVHLGIYFVSLSYFINPRIRHLYFDPRLRWWRSKSRYETHLPLLFKHDSTWQYPVLRNISEGGCFIETPHPLEMSEVLRIVLPLPIPLGLSTVQAEGEVRWISNNPLRSGMGVQFRNLGPPQEKAIQAFVKQQL